MSECEAQVYFAASPDGRLKIGTTTKPVSERLAAISHSLLDPLTLIGMIPGSYEVEKAIHTHLKEHRVKGEWFLDCKETRAVIDTILKKGVKGAGINIRRSPWRPAEDFVPSPPDPRLWVRMIDFMWGEHAVQQLASLGEVPVAIAQDWIDDKVRVPIAVQWAVAGSVITTISDGTPPDFCGTAKAERKLS